MKKALFLLALCSLVASMTVSVSAETKATAREATIKPEIDGAIDQVWGDADRMYGSNWGDTTEGLDNPSIVNSYASLMWDADGLYLLGVMYDTTIPDAEDVEARNSIDFWVSETYTDDTTFDAADGDWHYCKASTGEEVYYCGNETVYDEATTAVAVYDDHYVVEIFCPWQTEGFAPAIGTKIGFTVSFNDDIDLDGGRDSYAYWETTEASGAYWSETQALPKIEFVAGPEVAVDEPAEAPSTDAPAETPVTADAGIVAAAAVMAVAAGVVLSKRH